MGDALAELEQADMASTHTLLQERREQANCRRSGRRRVLQKSALSCSDRGGDKEQIRRVGGFPVPPPSSDLAELRSIVRQPVDKGQWPGACAAVFIDGHLRLLEECGFSDVEMQTSMTAHSIVRLYSMTKCIVAAALLQLVDDRRLSLDDYLHDHIPAFRSPRVLLENADGWPEAGKTEPARCHITLRHLLTHTSGIAGGAAPGLDGIRKWCARERAWIDVYKPLTKKVDRSEVTSLEGWVHELAKLPLWSHPGEHYSYGFSYDAIGRVIEIVTGMRLDRYLQARIFNPLQMHSTSFDLTGSLASKSQCLSTLYRYTKSSQFGADGRRPQLVRVDPLDIGGQSLWAHHCEVPSAGGCVSSLAGGLLSTMDDYATFLLAVLSGGQHPTAGVRIMSPAAAAELLADQTAKLQKPPKSASPYGDAGLGLSCMGEVQRKTCPSSGEWFDGVPGVCLWGGAANTAFKFDPNAGHPVLVLVFTQVVPQDSGITATSLLRAARAAAISPYHRSPQCVPSPPSNLQRMRRKGSPPQYTGVIIRSKRRLTRKRSSITRTPSSSVEIPGTFCGEFPIHLPGRKMRRLCSKSSWTHDDVAHTKKSLTEKTDARSNAPCGHYTCGIDRSAQLAECGA